jgi:ferric-dicitrate binding protein FerR (iron transport regulator)
MPWDQPPEGKGEAWERAQALWAQRAGADADASADADVDAALLQHCLAHGLEEWAARQCRFWLADHPKDARAQALLDRLLSAMHARLLAHLSADRSNLDARLSTTRRALSVAFTVAALALIIYLFSRYALS